MINSNRWNRLRYTLYAPVYDRIAGKLVAGRRRAIELLDPAPGSRVLIVGCGTGLDLELLPPGINVTAIDITPAMVERTRTRGKELGIDVDARVMDAAALDFEDGSFDAVLLHLVLAVVPNPGGTAREASRVLRNGGRAAIFDKFLDDDARPSRLRRLANIVTRIAATEINRKLAPLLVPTALRIVREEPSVFGGLFKVVLCEKRQATRNGETSPGETAL